MKAARVSRRMQSRKQAAGAAHDAGLLDLGYAPSQDSCTLPLSSFVASDSNGENAQALAVLPEKFTLDEQILAWCPALCAHSPVAAGLLRHAADDGWMIGVADLHNGGFHLDIPARRLLLDNFSMNAAALGRSIYFRNALLLNFLRALRDIHHEIRFGAFEADYPPEHVLSLERVRAADGDTVMVMMAWELRGAGFSDIWRHLLGSEEGDMAMVFTRYLERDPSALFDGAALAYTFRQWYADEDRVAGCDHQTLEALDDVLLSIPDLSNPFGQKELVPTALEDISVLPGGICYLAGLGRTLMRDPFFCGMNDPVNQTHMFHLMYDLEVVMVNNVPFRDSKLARQIFPGAEAVRAQRP